MSNDKLTPLEIHNLALDAAKKAATEFMNEYGEPLYCGFAWVKLYIDGRKPFAKQLVKAGAIKKGWDNGYIVWDPANINTQSIDIKEAGARAYARIIESFGIKAYAQSRAD